MFARRWVFLRMAVLCAGIGLLVAGGITYRLPRIYESRAVLEFSPRPKGIGFGFMTKESDWLTCRQVMRRAIEELDFGKAEGLAPEAALERLDGLVESSEVDEPTRTLVALRVHYHDATMARNLACTIVRCFEDYRAEYFGREKKRMMEALKNAVAEQEKTLAAARSKLEDAARNLSPSTLPDAPLEVEPPKLPLTAQELAEAGRREAERMRQEHAANRVILREAPEVPRLPVTPRVPLNLASGALAGLAVSPLLAWARLRYFRRRIAV